MRLTTKDIWNNYYLEMFQVWSLYILPLETSLNGSALPIAKIVLLKKLSKLVWWLLKYFSSSKKNKERHISSG